MWFIRWFDDGNRRVLTRRVETEQEAFEQACELRRHYELIEIEGPEGQRYDANAIIEWCVKHEK